MDTARGSPPRGGDLISDDDEKTSDDSNDHGSRPRWRRWLRRLGLGLLGILGVTAILVVLTLKTDAGRDVLAGILEDGVSSAITGQMRVERITDAGFGWVDVEGLRFESGAGDDVLRVERAHVEVSLHRLLAKKVDLHSTSVRGATVTIARGERNATTLEDAFESPGSGTSEGGVSVLLDASYEDVAVEVGFPSAPSFHVSSGSISLDHDPSREQRTRAELGGVHARVRWSDRDLVDGTSIRAAGSIFDLRARVCHELETVGVRMRLGGGQPAVSIDAERLLLRGGVAIADAVADVPLDRESVDLAGVPDCG